MPFEKIVPSRNRVTFYDSLTRVEISELAADREVKVIQTSVPVEPGTWEILNSELFHYRSDIELRVYEFSKGCDLSFLSKLSNVRRFAADCLMEVQGMQSISQLRNLESLSIGIYKLESFEFLSELDASCLRKLSLGATFSKNPDLSVIERFKRLQKLYVEGHRKGIETIGRLPDLEDITLRSITVSSLSFLVGLDKLRALGIKLGGTRNITELSNISSLKYLELWQVMGLATLTPISELIGLQYLFLQSLRHVSNLPDLSALCVLRRVYLESMNGLKSIAPLEAAPSIRDLAHINARGFEPSDYAGLIGKGMLKSLMVGFGSRRKNDLLQEMAKKAGVSTRWENDFVFD